MEERNLTGPGAAMVLVPISAAIDTIGGYLLGRGLIVGDDEPPHLIYLCKT